MIEMIDQELYLKGKIDAVNADQIFQQGLNVIQRQQNFPLVVNLAGLEQGSTLALAVLVQWLRQTPQHAGLQFKDVPEKMMKIIQACHLEHDLQLI